MSFMTKERRARPRDPSVYLTRLANGLRRLDNRLRTKDRRIWQYVSPYRPSREIPNPRPPRCPTCGRVSWDLELP